MHPIVTYVVDTLDLDENFANVLDALTAKKLAMFLNGRALTFFHDRISDRFANNGDEVVGQWLPLTAATLRLKQKKGWSLDTNIRTGDMRDWFLSARFGVRRMSRDEIELAFPARAATGELARKIQTAQVGRGKTPARPILGLGPTDLEETISALSDSISEFF